MTQTTTPPARRVLRAVRGAAALLGCVLLLLVVGHAAVTVALRVAFPFQIEWSEGTSFLQGIVLRESGVLYPDPHETSFVPHVYTPLHAMLVAALSAVAGNHLPVGRALSLAATLAAAAVLFRWARGIGAGPPGAAAGVLWFLASFLPTGQWFDLVRVDMVFLLPFVLALEALFRPDGPRPVRGAAWLAAAYFAKQTALFYAPPLAVFLWWRAGRRAALRFGVLFGGLLAAPLALLHVTSGGWSTYYLFQAVGGHPLEQAPWVRLVEVVVFVLPAAAAAALVRGRTTLDLLLLALLSAVLSGLAFAKHGGYDNAWLPLVAGVAPAAALLVSRFPAGSWLLLGASALFLHGRWSGWREPGDAVRALRHAGAEFRAMGLRSERDRTALQRAVDHVASIPGAVFCPDDPWIAWRAGKGIQTLMHLANELGIADFVPKPVERAVRGEPPRPFTAIVFAESPLDLPGRDSLEFHEERFRSLVRERFEPAERIPYESAAVGLTRFGLVIRPGRVYRRVPR